MADIFKLIMDLRSDVKKSIQIAEEMTKGLHELVPALREFADEMRRLDSTMQDIKPLLDELVRTKKDLEKVLRAANKI